MKQIPRVMVMAIVLVFGAGTLSLAQRGQQVDGALTDQRYRDATTLRLLIENVTESYVLIDVRTDQEFRDGYIPSAINLPVQIIQANPPDVDRDSLVILYCRTGNRSGTAKRILEQLGYTRVVDFGGISRWPYPVLR